MDQLPLLRSQAPHPVSLRRAKMLRQDVRPMYQLRSHVYYLLDIRFVKGSSSQVLPIARGGATLTDEQSPMRTVKKRKSLPLIIRR